jgi:bacterioferritin
MILANEIKLEVAAQKTAKEGIAACEELGDYVLRELFQHILDDTDEHINWLETRLDMIKSRHPELSANSNGL